MRRSPMRLSVLVAAIAGTAGADEPAGTIAAELAGATRQWVVVAGGFTESGNVVHLTVTGHPGAEGPETTGAIRLDLAVTRVEGDAAGVFGTGPVLVTAQDIHYLPGADARPYSSAFGGAASVTLEAFAREDDRLAIEGTFTARLVRRDAPNDEVPLDGRFDVRVQRLGG